MQKRTWYWIGALALIIVLLIVLRKTGLIGGEEGLEVAIEPVTLRTITETVSASGKIYPETEVKVSPDISGEIVELNVAEGDSVRRGTVLARIYADIYTTQRDQAAAMVQQERARVENSRAQLPGLQSALELAKRNYERQQQLLEEKVISRSEFEQAQTAYLRAQADYNAALEIVRGGQAGVASAEANLLRAAKDLSRTSVLAPMDGVISQLSVKKGERVVGNSMMAGTEMMRIADMRRLEVRVDVGENDIPKVALGDSAIIELDAYGTRKFRGVVTQIASSSGQAGLTGSTTATADVTNYMVYIYLLPDSYADLIDPEKPRKFPFRPGMSARAEIRTQTRANVPAVPINAVTTRQADPTKLPQAPETNSLFPPEETDLQEVVFVLGPDNRVRQRTVKTGIQDINYIEILQGLDTGQQVVTAPYQAISKTLSDSMRVKVVPRDKLFSVK